MLRESEPAGSQVQRLTAKPPRNTMYDVCYVCWLFYAYIGMNCVLYTRVGVRKKFRLSATIAISAVTELLYYVHKVLNKNKNIIFSPTLS